MNGRPVYEVPRNKQQETTRKVAQAQLTDVMPPPTPLSSSSFLLLLLFFWFCSSVAWRCVRARRVAGQRLIGSGPRAGSRCTSFGTRTAPSGTGRLAQTEWTHLPSLPSRPTTVAWWSSFPRAPGRSERKMECMLQRSRSRSMFSQVRVANDHRFELDTSVRVDCGLCLKGMADQLIRRSSFVLFVNILLFPPTPSPERHDVIGPAQSAVCLPAFRVCVLGRLSRSLLSPECLADVCNPSLLGQDVCG